MRFEIKKGGRERGRNRLSNQTASSKPVPRSYNFVPAASAIVGATATPSTATSTDAGSMDLFFGGKYGPLSQEENNRRDRLSLCRYCVQE